MIAACLTGYIQNGNTLQKKKIYIKDLLINPVSIKVSVQCIIYQYVV